MAEGLELRVSVPFSKKTFSEESPRQSKSKGGTYTCLNLKTKTDNPSRLSVDTIAHDSEPCRGLNLCQATTFASRRMDSGTGRGTCLVCGQIGFTGCFEGLEVMS